MGMVFVGLGGLLGLVSFVCAIIVLIDAFKNEVWKGIVGLLCGLYLLYYGFAEFQHEKKGLILLGWLGGMIAAYACYFMGAAAMVVSSGGGAPSP